MAQTRFDEFSHKGAPKKGERGYRPDPFSKYPNAWGGQDPERMANHIIEMCLLMREDPWFAPEWLQCINYGCDGDPPIDSDGSFERTDFEGIKEDLCDSIGIPIRNLNGEMMGRNERFYIAMAAMTLALETVDGAEGRSDLGYDLSERRLRRMQRRNVTPTEKQMYVAARVAKEDHFKMPVWLAKAILADSFLPPEAALRLVVYPKAQAAEFINYHHSKLPRINPRGLMYSIAVLKGRRAVAVATVNTPTGRWDKEARTKAGKLDHKNVIELTRVASDGTVTGASSMLVSRVIDLIEHSKRGDKTKPGLLVTYQLTEENGSTYKGLRDKGLRPVSITKGSKSDTGSGSRKGSKNALHNADKIRWEAGALALPADWSLVGEGKAQKSPKSDAQVALALAEGEKAQRQRKMLLKAMKMGGMAAYKRLKAKFQGEM